MTVAARVGSIRWPGSVESTRPCMLPSVRFRSANAMCRNASRRSGTGMPMTSAMPAVGFRSDATTGCRLIGASRSRLPDASW